MIVAGVFDDLVKPEYELSDSDTWDRPHAIRLWKNNSNNLPWPRTRSISQKPKNGMKVTITTSVFARDLVPSSTEQVLRDDVPGLVMRQAVDHVFDHGDSPK